MPTDSETNKTHCVLVPLRLMIPVRLVETHFPIITAASRGDLRPVYVVYKASEIYVIFYPARILDIVF